MTYTYSVGIALGSGNTGLTLSAQLVDTAGANVGSAVASGFVELGEGNYLWTYASFPDGFRGAVKFTSGSIIVAVPINPQDAEYLDAKVSTRSSLGAGSAQHTHTATNGSSGPPLDGVEVWVTTNNSAAGNVVASGVTDSLGQVTFYLDPGTYYLWEQLAGYSFTNPQTITVS